MSDAPRRWRDAENERYFSSAGVPRAACASSSSKSYTITSLAASSSPACFSASVSFEASSVSSTLAASATSRASAASTSGATGGGPYGRSSHKTCVCTVTMSTTNETYRMVELGQFDTKEGSISHGSLVVVAVRRPQPLLPII